VCFREYRKWMIPAVLELIEKPRRWKTVTLIFYTDAMTDQQFYRSGVEVIRKLKARLRRQLKRAGVKGPIAGSFEVDFHPDIGRWMPHCHLLVPAQPKALERFRAWMKSEANLRTRKGVKSRPMVIDKLNDPANQVSYLFKSYCMEVRAYQKTGRPKRGTRKVRLSNSQLALSLIMQDRLGFKGVRFLYEVRLNRKRLGALSSSKKLK